MPVLSATIRVPATEADVHMPISPTAHIVIRSIVAAMMIAAASSRVALPSRRTTVVARHICVFVTARIVIRFHLTADIQRAETPVLHVRMTLLETPAH